MYQTFKKVFFSVLFFPKFLFQNQKQSFLSNFISLLILVFIVFYYGSLFFFSPFDESFITSTTRIPNVMNPFGLMGSYLSSLSIFYFGLSSWVLPLPLFFFLLSQIEKGFFFFLQYFLSWFLGFFSLVFLFTFYFESYSLQGVSFLASGVLGDLITKNLITYFGSYGSVFLSVLFAWFCVSSLLRVKFLSFRFIFSPFFLVRRFFSWAFSKNHSSEEQELSVPQKSKKLKQKKIASSKSPSSSSSVSSKEGLVEEKFLESLRSLFKKTKRPSSSQDEEDDSDMAELILKTFHEFGLKGKILDYTRGPSLVTYNFQPEEGVRQSKVYGLSDDLALALRVQCVMIKPAQDERALGIQVPRKNPEVVYLGDILKDPSFEASVSPLTLALGLSEKGEPVCEDLASMPHLLIAGSTGSGKSVCLNTFICSILTKASPDDVRFLMIDPKMLELSVYNNIPHLLAPVITTDLNKAKAALNWAVYEMERRYTLMEKEGVRDLSSYNRKIKVEQDKSKEVLPAIVVIIDELADLMLMAAKDVEQLIQRLTQKARACGIHLILATQRPSVDVVTGVIKANLPCRISFRVVSRYDSKTILDQNDADKLLGRGDMFFMKPGAMSLRRIQGAFVSEEEVKVLTKKLSYFEGSYREDVVDWIEENKEEEKSNSSSLLGGPSGSSFEELYEEAKEIARSHGLVSTSFLQRQLSLGYNRAAKIIEKMEQEGLISGQDGSKKRKWIQE